MSCEMKRHFEGHACACFSRFCLVCADLCSYVKACNVSLITQFTKQLYVPTVNKITSFFSPLSVVLFSPPCSALIVLQKASVVVMSHSDQTSETLVSHTSTLPLCGVVFNGI